MEFRKYSSITNTYNNKFIDQIMQSIKKDDRFLCFEKLHGTNFQIRLFETDSKLTIEYGRRTGILHEDTNFMDYEKHLVTPKFVESVTHVWELLKSDEVNQITIFGEYFGGRYPHLDLDPDSNKPVQKDIWYSQTRMFCGFDILVSSCSKKEDQYIDVKDANEIFKTCDIFCLDPIKEGTLDELLEFDVENLKTTIPSRVGLPEIENNFAEGIIIRPINECKTFRNNRVILKKKRSKFSEKKTIRNNVIKHKTPLSEKVINLINELESYITVARLNNLISKYGQIPEERKIMKFAGLYAQDIFQEYEEETGHRLNTMETSDRKVVSSTINKFACDLIKENLESAMESN